MMTYEQYWGLDQTQDEAERELKAQLAEVIDQMACLVDSDDLDDLTTLEELKKERAELEAQL